MKTLLVVASNSHSVIHYKREFFESLRAQNVSIVVCTPLDANTPHLIKTFKKGISLVPLKLDNTKKNLWADIGTLFQLAKIIKQYQIDAVFSYHMKPVVYTSLIARMRGVKNIYSMITGLGYAFTIPDKWQTHVLRAFLMTLLRFSLGFNTRIFFQNTDDLNLICHSSKLRKKAVAVKGEGINLTLFPFSPLPQALSFLFAGRLLTHKGIEEYVKAARILKRKYPHVSFKIAGGFHSNPAVISKKALDGWIKEGIIDYLGDVTDILPVLQDASVCVLPSYREGCPRVLSEAMAVGRALITTDAPGCRDTVIEGRNGYLVPIQDADKLKEAMEDLINNPSRLQTMGEESRSLAQEQFDVRKINQILFHEMGLNGKKAEKTRQSLTSKT